MTKRFNFDSADNLYAYSVERLIELCQPKKVQNEDNTQTDEYDQEQIKKAYEHIIEGNIEEWLLEIGENELCDLVNKKRKELNIIKDNKETDDNKRYKVENVCEALSEKINNRKFIDLLDINRAIDTTLKEYETLRSEILQNASEISQLILLGLAAIFTIASIGLAPLSDFLTVEDTIIDMPFNLEGLDKIEINKTKDETNTTIIETDPAKPKTDPAKPKTDPPKTETNTTKNKTKTKETQKIITNSDSFRISNYEDIEEEDIIRSIDLSEFDSTIKQEIIEEVGEPNLKDGKLIVVGKLSKPEYFLRIKKTTNGETIEEQGIVPSIVIFNWLIPFLSLFLISRSLGNLQKNKVIGEYIYNRVEQKLVNLSILRKNYLKFDDKEINDQVIKNNYRQYLTHISWENYIVERGKNYSGPSDLDLIFYLFTSISFISFVGGTALLLFDFNGNQWFWDDFQQIEFILLLVFLVGFLVGFLLGFLLVKELIFIVIFKFLKVSKRTMYNFLKFLQISKFNKRNKFLFWVVFSFLVLSLYAIIIYFVQEITNGGDILKFIFLLVIPFFVYSLFIYISLRKKSEVDNQIFKKKKNKSYKKNINKVIHEVMDEMWK